MSHVNASMPTSDGLSDERRNAVLMAAAVLKSTQVQLAPVAAMTGVGRDLIAQTEEALSALRTAFGVSADLVDAPPFPH